MKRKKWKKLAGVVAALGASALLALAYPALKAHILSAAPAYPPGKAPARRQLVTVWLAGELPGAADWLRGRAAAYEKAKPGTSVWLRRATERDIAAMDAAPPDLLLFTADTAAPPGGARALCLSGYVLLLPDREAATAAPRSLFGRPPTPDPAAEPPREAPAWPQTFAADDGFGASALTAMDAPAGGYFVSPGETLSRFLNGEAALLSVSQARAAEAQGARYHVLAAAPATNLALYARAHSPAGEDLLAYLDEGEARLALADHALIPASPGPFLYGPDRPLLAALERALADGWVAPACEWPRIRRETELAAQAIYKSEGKSP